MNFEINLIFLILQLDKNLTILKKKELLRWKHFLLFLKGIFSSFFSMKQITQIFSGGGSPTLISRKQSF